MKPHQVIILGQYYNSRQLLQFMASRSMICFLLCRKNTADIQGFQYKQGPFIAKSVTIKDADGSTLGEFMLAPPLPFFQISPLLRQQCRWLTRFKHGLRWDQGNIHYATASRVITECLTAKTIEVRGHQKKKWLQDILPSDYTVIDVME